VSCAAATPPWPVSAMWRCVMASGTWASLRRTIAGCLASCRPRRCANARF